MRSRVVRQAAATRSRNSSTACCSVPVWAVSALEAFRTNVALSVPFTLHSTWQDSLNAVRVPVAEVNVTVQGVHEE